MCNIFYRNDYIYYKSRIRTGSVDLGLKRVQHSADSIFVKKKTSLPSKKITATRELSGSSINRTEPENSGPDSVSEPG